MITVQAARDCSRFYSIRNVLSYLNAVTGACSGVFANLKDNGQCKKNGQYECQYYDGRKEDSDENHEDSKHDAEDVRDQDHSERQRDKKEWVVIDESTKTLEVGGRRTLGLLIFPTSSKQHSHSFRSLLC